MEKLFIDAVIMYLSRVRDVVPLSPCKMSIIDLSRLLRPPDVICRKASMFCSCAFCQPTFNLQHDPAAQRCNAAMIALCQAKFDEVGSTHP